MARKKAETTTEKKLKEKKILTPADYGPFDILKLMFTDPVKFEEIPLKTLEKSYYIINDRLSMGYPMQSCVFNHAKINGGWVVKCWQNFLQRQGWNQVPKWIYTKGKKKTEEVNVSQNIISKERLKKYAYAKNISVHEAEFALEIFSTQMTAEITEWEKQMEELEKLKKASLASLKKENDEEEELTLTTDSKNTDPIF